MKFGVISLGGTSGQWILEKAKKYFDECNHINIKELEVRTSKNGREVFYQGEPLSYYDCIYIRGSFRYGMIQQAVTEVLGETTYIPFTPEAFPTCHNKFLTLMALQKENLPVPRTHFAATTAVAKKILEDTNFPVIIKIPEGTQGKGVMFADSLESANTVLDAMEAFRQPYLIQEYIETESTDIRVIVGGGKVLASMRRRAAGNEKRANIHMGGIGEPYDLDYDTEQIALRAAKAIGAEICGIDILEGSKKAIIEANTSPGLKGITEATKQDIAGEIAKILYENTLNFSGRKKKNDYYDMLSDLNIDKPKTKEIMTNLNIRAGFIKLPDVVTKLSGLKDQDDVMITVDKGKVDIRKN